MTNDIKSPYITVYADLLLGGNKTNHSYDELEPIELSAVLKEIKKIWVDTEHYWFDVCIAKVINALGGFQEESIVKIKCFEYNTCIEKNVERLFPSHLIQELCKKPIVIKPEITDYGKTWLSNQTIFVKFTPSEI
jgi:hypothetical protein